jgi:hypothetical protein
MERLKILTLLLLFISVVISLPIFSQTPSVGYIIRGQKPDGSFSNVQVDSNGVLKSTISASVSAELYPNTFDYHYYTADTNSRTLTSPAGTVAVSIQVKTPGASVKWLLGANTMTINDGDLVTWFAEDKIDAGVPVAFISSETTSKIVIKFKRKV